MYVTVSCRHCIWLIVIYRQWSSQGMFIYIKCENLFYDIMLHPMQIGTVYGSKLMQCSYILNVKICSMISCSTPCKHCHIRTESKIGLIVNNIYGTRGAVTKQSSQHYVDPVILDAICCAQSRAHEPLINLDIVLLFYILIAAGSWN